MHILSALKNGGRFWNSTGLTLSVFSAISAAVSLGLPYWVTFHENVLISGLNTSDHVTWNYHSGFWWHCNQLVTESMTSYRCGGITNHKDWQQAVICLLLLSIILSANAAVNSAFYLTFMKNDRLCLYISLTSAALSAVAILIGDITYGSQDQTITVLAIVFDVTASNLYCAFWLAVISCICVILASLVYAIAIFKHVDIAIADSDSQTSFVTIGAKTSTHTSEDVDIKNVSKKDELRTQVHPIVVVDCYIHENVTIDESEKHALFNNKNIQRLPAIERPEVNNSDTGVTQKENFTSHSSTERGIGMADKSSGTDANWHQWMDTDTGVSDVACYSDQAMAIKCPGITSSILVREQPATTKQDIININNTDTSQENSGSGKDKSNVLKQHRSKSAFQVRKKHGSYAVWKKSFAKNNYPVHLRRYTWTNLPPVETFLDSFACEQPARVSNNTLPPSGIFVTSSNYDILVGPQRYPRCLTDIAAPGNPPDETTMGSWRLNVTTKHTINGVVLHRARTELTSSDISQGLPLNGPITNEKRCHEESPPTTYSNIVPETLDVLALTSKPPKETNSLPDKRLSITDTKHRIPYSKHVCYSENQQQPMPTKGRKQHTYLPKMHRHARHRVEHRPDYVLYAPNINILKTCRIASRCKIENNNCGSEALAASAEITVDPIYKH